jgi:hypothetical protein
MLFHICSTIAWANQFVRLRLPVGSKPLMIKGQRDMPAFLAQSPCPIYRPTREAVFP